MTVAQIELLEVVASGDHDQLATHLASIEGSWWARLQALERRHLVTVAMVGPHRQPWPWITVQLTPTGHQYLNGGIS